MKKALFVFLFASSLAAQVQLGKNVQIGGGGTGTATTLQTNGTNNTSQTTLNFVNPTTFNGLTFTFSNAGANETFTLGGTLGNAGLTNPSMTINSVTCTLGSPCTIPSGGGSISGGVAGYAPLFGSATTITGPSHLNELTGGVSTFTQPVAVNDGTGKAGNIGLLAGTAPSAAPANTVQINAPTSVAAYSVTLPGAQGAGSLTNNGSGVLTWNPSGGAAFPALVAQPTPASTTFLQTLNNAKNVPVHIAVFGDSFTIADHANAGAGNGPVTSTNRWAEQLRIQLQALYGSHGTGVYPVQLTVSGSVTANSEAWSCTGTVGTSNILGPTQGSGNSLITLAPGASCTFHDSRNIAWDTLNTYCATNASSVGLTVNIDSGAFTGTACGTTTGSATAHVVTLAATSSTSHSVTFTNSAGSGTAYLYAAEGQSGTTGVSVDLMGVGGATAAFFGATPTTELAFSDLIPGGTQAALFQDQTNDAAAGVATGTFSTNIQNFITHEQALSSSPTVMLVIPPVDVVNGTAPMAPYTAIQTGLCTTNSITCINIQNRGTTVGSTAVGWGTTYIPSILWDLTGAAWPTGNAGVHPSDAGNLDEAQMIYAQLVNPVSAGGCTTNCTITGTGTTPALTINSNASIAQIINSPDNGGTIVILQGTGLNTDEWGIQSGGNATSPGGKQFLIGDFTSGIYSWGQRVSATGLGQIIVPSLMVNCWSSLASANVASCDTGLSRDSAGVIDFGNGTQGDKSATLKAASLLVSGNVDGTAPVTITTGTTATLGGTFKSGYTFNQEATAATAVAYTLPTAAAGLQYCVGNSWNGSAATTGVLTVNASAAGQFIIFTDGTLSATGGNVTSGGAAADFACFVGVDSTHWYFKPSSGTWTKH